MAALVNTRDTILRVASPRYTNYGVDSQIALINSTLADIASDTKITAAERQALRKEWDVLITEYVNNSNQGLAYLDNLYPSVATYYSNGTTGYADRMQELATYLNAGTTYTMPSLGSSPTDAPNWISNANLSSNATVSITADTFRTKWKQVYDSRTVLINKATDEAGKVANWTGVTSRPNTFRVSARGYSSTQHQLESGLYNGETGANLVGYATFWRIAKINRSTSAVTDVYGGNDATAFVSALNGITGSGWIVVVFTWDEPQGLVANYSTVRNALYAHGASRAILGSPNFAYRSAYILVGISNCTEGNGFEAYNGVGGSGSTNDWCEVSFYLQNSNLVISGSAATPRTLADYSYTGSLNATADILLTNTANCTIVGNNVTNTNGSGSSWDAGVRSTYAYTGSVQVEVTVGSTGTAMMLGFNTSATSNAGYAELYYALYLRTDNTLEIYHLNSSVVGGLGSYSVGDRIAVIIEQNIVKFTKNGSILYVMNRTPSFNDIWYLDTSFYTVGGSLTNIKFTQLIANTTKGTNLFDTSGWETSASGNYNQPGGWTANPLTGTGTLYNFIRWNTGPDGSTVKTWIGYNSGSANNQAGGIHPSQTVTIDKTKKYRISVWIMKSGSNYDGSEAGNIYLGPQPNAVNDMSNGGLNTNPYVVQMPRSSLTYGVWYLFVGYIFPYTVTGPAVLEGGVFHGPTGTAITAGIVKADYRWLSTTTEANFRIYQYYTSSNANAGIDIWGPRIEICDGSEPSLHQLLSIGSVSGINKIGASNVDNFVNNSAISTPQMASTAITRVLPISTTVQSVDTSGITTTYVQQSLNSITTSSTGDGRVVIFLSGNPTEEAVYNYNGWAQILNQSANGGNWVYLRLFRDVSGTWTEIYRRSFYWAGIYNRYAFESAGVYTDTPGAGVTATYWYHIYSVSDYTARHVLRINALTGVIMEVKK